MDESTGISSTAHMLLCGTFIDKKYELRDTLIDIFDVSKDGDTVGAALHDRVDRCLSTHALHKKVDASHADGASNVCDYPGRGAFNS
jgi:hypothetical protein